jgi:prophage regulatory protein
MNNSMEDRLIRLKEVLRMTGLSRTSQWRFETKGLFPARRRVSQNIVAWKLSEVQDWINSKELAA